MPEIVDKIEPYIRRRKVHDYELEYYNFHCHRYEYLFKLLDEYPREQSLLDIGAGYLHFLLGAKEMGFLSLSAIDQPRINRGLEARGQEFNFRLSECNLKNDNLPFDDGSFDLIFFSETLEHFNFYPLPVFVELYRVLKPGGTLIITTPNLTRLNNRIKMLFGRSINYDITNNQTYGAHFREYNKSELNYLLDKSGFKTLKVIYKDFNYPDQNKFVSIVNTIFDHICPPLRPNLIVIAKK